MKSHTHFQSEISKTLYVAEDGHLYCMAYRVVGIERVIGFLGFLTVMEHDPYPAK